MGVRGMVAGVTVLFDLGFDVVIRKVDVVQESGDLLRNVRVKREDNATASGPIFINSSGRQASSKPMRKIFNQVLLRGNMKYTNSFLTLYPVSLLYKR